jgi:hypothetical protein
MAALMLPEASRTISTSVFAKAVSAETEAIDKISKTSENFIFINPPFREMFLT